MSLRQVLLVVAAVLVGLVAVVAVILWSGRGFLEATKSAAGNGSEWLTVGSEHFEFRGTLFQTPEALLTGLLQHQPKPQLVSVRWLVRSGDATPSEVMVARVSEARGALAKARIASSEGVVGNQIFEVKPSASPKWP